MGWTPSVVDAEGAANMYAEGYTLQQIGEHYGVSRQRIHQILTEGKVKPRRWSKIYKEIPYKGLYEYVRDNKDVSITSLSRLLFFAPCRATDMKVMRLLQGCNVPLSVSQIKRLEEASGMPFSYLFQKKGDA